MTITPSKKVLVQEIRAALGSLASPKFGAASAVYDIFEAYVWALVIDAARNEGASIQYKNVAGGTTSSLVFRTSPGAIYSVAKPYTHAELNFQGCPGVEAHLGIFVSGDSGVPNECDVAVLYQTEADMCRRSQAHPRCRKLVLAVECKFYSTNLRVDLARSFLGLTEEIQKQDRFFVSNVSSRSVSKMLEKHKRDWETQVSPSNRRLQERLHGHFESTFKKFKARHL